MDHHLCSRVVYHLLLGRDGCAFLLFLFNSEIHFDVYFCVGWRFWLVGALGGTVVHLHPQCTQAIWEVPFALTLSDTTTLGSHPWVHFK